MEISWRKANIQDAELYFNWVNERIVRLNSYHKNEIGYPEHVEWFRNKLESPDCFFYLFIDENKTPIGQVRIDRSAGEVIIGISIDKNYREKGLGNKMLIEACGNYFIYFPAGVINAYIKKDNPASIKIFEKAGFVKEEELTVFGSESYRLTKINQ